MMTAETRPTIHHWAPTAQLGGVEMALLAFVQGARDMDHMVFTADGQGPAAAFWREAGAEVVEVGGWDGLLGLAWLRRWRCACDRHRIDRIILWSPTRLPWVLAPLKPKTRAVVHFGTAGKFGWKTRIIYSIAQILLRSQCRPSLAMCSARVAESLAPEHMLAGLSRFVIHNAVQSAYLAARRSVCGSSGEWGMVARLDALKDHSTLLKAVRLIGRRHPNFRLTIVGEGLMRAAIEQEVRELGVGDKVTLTGTIARPWELMAGWGGAVFSTGPQEGFGIAAAEAMAMGLPCVFTDLPVMREVGGDTVLYAEPGSLESLAEKISTLIADPALADRLGQAAALRARECFSPQAFAAAYLRAFELSA